MVTYGDLMSLLLTFFVLLVSMSELKRDTRFQKVMESIRIAFGHEGGIGRTPTKEPPVVSIIKKLMEIQIPKEIKHIGSSPDPGLEDRFFTVAEIEDGWKLSFGGALQFERFSDELLSGRLEILENFSTQIIGRNNVVEIIGHTTVEPLPTDSIFKDKDGLALARARVVRDHLVKLGINPKRLRLVSVADHEPLFQQAYEEHRLARNRRVEIVVRESLINQYEGREQTVEDRVSHGQ